MINGNSAYELFDMFLSSEQAAIYKEGYDLLVTLDYPNLEQEFAEILSTAGDNHRDTVVFKTTGAVIDRIRHALSMQGLGMSTDTPVGTLVRVLKCMYLLQAADDTGVISGVLANDESDVDKMVSILKDYSGVSEITLLESIEYVNPNLVKILKTIYDGADTVENLLDASGRYAPVIKALSEWDTKDTMLVRFMQAGITPGHKFNTYMAYLPNNLFSMDVSLVALELVGVMSICGDVGDDPLGWLKGVLSVRVHDTAKELAIFNKVSFLRGAFGASAPYAKHVLKKG